MNKSTNPDGSARPIFPADAEIEDSATVHETASIGEGCTIGEGASIGERVVIGNKCKLEPNAVIGWMCQLGDEVVVSERVKVQGVARIPSGQIVRQNTCVRQFMPAYITGPAAPLTYQLD